MRKIYLGILFLFITITTVQAQDQFTPEFLWKLKRVGEFAISPDDKQIAYGITTYDIAENKGNANIWLLPIIGGQPKQITDFQGNENHLKWRPDGKKIGFLATQNKSTQIWETNIEGTEKTQVSTLEGDVNDFAYSSKQNYIALLMDVKLDQKANELYPDLPKVDARIIDDLMYRHWDSWHDFNYTHVFYAAYKDGKIQGKPVDIMPNEKFDAESITFHPDGNIIAYVSKKLTGKEAALQTNTNIYFYDLTTQKTTNITEEMKGYDKNPVFSSDGKTMAFTSMERNGFESDKNRLMLYDLKSGKKEDLTQQFAEGVNDFVWAKDGKKIYFTAVVKACVQLFEVEVSSKKIRQITTGRQDYNKLALIGNDLMSSKCTTSMPHELVKVNIKTGEEQQLTSTNKELLAKVKMGKVEERIIKTTDGKDMLVWVIFPPDFDKNKKYPALLYCQGGPQSPVSQFFSYRWNFQLMAAQGYVVVAPNRRGLPGFGRDWNDDISGDWGGQPIQDYLSAIDAVAKEPYINKDKLGAVGASYGGFSVYYLAGHHQKRFKTFVSHCGLFNLESWYGTTEEMFFANWDIKGAYWDQPRSKSYEKFSPHTFVKNWDTPILVIHGEKDFRVPIGEGMQAFSAAQLQNIPSRFLYFPDEGHWVMKPQNSILWNRVFFEWLDKWLK